MKKHVLFLFIVAGLWLSCIALSYSQSLSEKRKWYMIDSADQARTEKYLRHCFPEFSFKIAYKKDSTQICSLETAFRIAPDADDNEFEQLEKFVQQVSTYYNIHHVHILFQYGLLPGDVDVMFDRTFNKKEIFISSGERNTTHQQTIELIAAFNKITDSYVRNKNRNK
jgi:hypothetical protein